MAPTFAAKAAAGASFIHHLELLTPVILMFYLAALPSLADSLPTQRKFMPDDRRDFLSFSEAARKYYSTTNRSQNRDSVGALNNYHHQRLLMLQMLPQWYEEIYFKNRTTSEEKFHGNDVLVAEKRKTVLNILQHQSQLQRKKRKKNEIQNIKKLQKNQVKLFSKLIKERRKRKVELSEYENVNSANLRKRKNSKKEKILENFKYNFSGSFDKEEVLDPKKEEENGSLHEIILLNPDNFTSTTSATSTESKLDKETGERRKGNGE